MARPVDADRLIEWFTPYLHTGEPIPPDVVIEDIRAMPTLTQPNEWISVEDRLPESEPHQPTFDVRPVVRGRWIEKPYLLGTTNVCSVCGENYGMPHGKYNFCPRCGADMRGETK